MCAWEAVYGPVPKGHELDHLCRVRACINTEHLEPVISAVNVQRGDRARLREDQVREIRKLLAEGYMLREIAPLYGVCFGTIGAIARGKTWKNIA